VADPGFGQLVSELYIPSLAHLDAERVTMPTATDCCILVIVAK
jgi:hypothetical protein